MFERGSEGIVREVDSCLFGIIGQSTDDQLGVRRRGCCLSGQRHDEVDLYVLSFGGIDSYWGKGGQGAMVRIDGISWGKPKAQGTKHEARDR